MNVALVFAALDLAGIALFALSGGIIAARKGLDPFGAAVIGMAAGMGGGTIRDILLGALPVYWIEAPHYLAVALFAGVAGYYGSELVRGETGARRRALVWADAAGLSVFCVLGAQAGLAAGAHWSIALVTGVLSAAFGGVLRDVIVNDVPLIFREDIYALAALFGAGVMLMVGEGERDGRVSLHRRRMAWLLVFGLVHGFVIWFGDILAPYALAGFVVIFFRRMKPFTLFLLGFLGIVFSGLLTVGQIWAMGISPEMSAPQKFGIIPTEASLEQWISAYQSSFLMSRVFNAIGETAALLGQITVFAGRIVGVMLIGMGLFKTGFFTARWPIAVYALIAILTLGGLLPVLWWNSSVWIANDFALDLAWRGSAINYAASLFIAFGYASAVMAVSKIDWLSAVRAPFAAAGRMAFTNYLTHSIVLTIVFAGFGYFGTIERTGQLAIVLGMYVVQLIVSPLWLMVFRFGPAEWLWRTLSYQKAQPFLRRKGDETAPA